MEISHEISRTNENTTHGRMKHNIFDDYTGKPLSTQFKVSSQRKVSLDDFILLRVIGKGSFGKVMLVKCSFDNQVYAMKVLRKHDIIQRNQVAHTMTERSVLEKLRHPFIVNLIYAFQTPKKLYFILEYCPGGELFFHLSRSGRFDEYRARFYSAELLLALEHLHKYNVAYRDMKPENVLLDRDGHVKLTDFGLSKAIVEESNSTASLCGTPEYIAPEILQQQSILPYAVDWWSFGALLYEMLTGLPPFYSRDRQILFSNICYAPLRFPSHVSETARDLLQHLLDRNPTTRFNAQQTKCHPFFQGIDWSALMLRKVKPPFVPDVFSEDDTQNFEESFVNLPVVNSEDFSHLELRSQMFPIHLQHNQSNDDSSPSKTKNVDIANSQKRQESSSPPEKPFKTTVQSSAFSSETTTNNSNADVFNDSPVETFNKIESEMNRKIITVHNQDDIHKNNVIETNINDVHLALSASADNLTLSEPDSKDKNELVAEVGPNITFSATPHDSESFHPTFKDGEQLAKYDNSPSHSNALASLKGCVNLLNLQNNAALPPVVAISYNNNNIANNQVEFSFPGFTFEGVTSRDDSILGADSFVTAHNAFYPMSSITQRTEISPSHTQSGNQNPLITTLNSNNNNVHKPLSPMSQHHTEDGFYEGNNASQVKPENLSNVVLYSPPSANSQRLQQVVVLPTPSTFSNNNALTFKNLMLASFDQDQQTVPNFSSPSTNSLMVPNSGTANSLNSPPPFCSSHPNENQSQNLLYYPQNSSFFLSPPFVHQAQSTALSTSSPHRVFVVASSQQQQQQQPLGLIGVPSENPNLVAGSYLPLNAPPPSSINNNNSVSNQQLMCRSPQSDGNGFSVSTALIKVPSSQQEADDCIQQAAYHPLQQQQQIPLNHHSQLNQHVPGFEYQVLYNPQQQHQLQQHYMYINNNNNATSSTVSSTTFPMQNSTSSVTMSSSIKNATSTNVNNPPALQPAPLLESLTSCPGNDDHAEGNQSVNPISPQRPNPLLMVSPPLLTQQSQQPRLNSSFVSTANQATTAINNLVLSPNQHSSSHTNSHISSHTNSSNIPQQNQFSSSPSHYQNLIPTATTTAPANSESSPPPPLRTAANNMNSLPSPSVYIASSLNALDNNNAATSSNDLSSLPPPYSSCEVNPTTHYFISSSNGNSSLPAKFIVPPPYEPPLQAVSPHFLTAMFNGSVMFSPNAGASQPGFPPGMLLVNPLTSNGYSANANTNTYPAQTFTTYPSFPHSLMYLETPSNLSLSSGVQKHQTLAPNQTFASIQQHGTNPYAQTSQIGQGQ